MKTKILLVVAFACLALAASQTVSGLAARTTAVEDSKVQPKEYTLGLDSKDPKYKDVAFSHVNHATMKYSIDGNSVMACIECHHTDAPAASLKAPYKTGERDKVLTAAVLEEPASKGVKKCRVCHLQAGDDTKEIPTITYEGDTEPTEIRNDVAYHKNCNTCHDAAIAARPALKCAEPFPCKEHTIPGGKQCYACHKPPAA